MAANGYIGQDPELVPITGGTMTGPLVLSGDPVTDLQAATKHYADTVSASAAATAVTTHAGASDPHGDRAFTSSAIGALRLSDLAAPTGPINLADMSLVGSTSSGGTLTLSSTSNATKGKILLGSSAYDEANNRLGLRTTSPSATLHAQQSSGTTITQRYDVSGDTTGRLTVDANGLHLWGSGSATGDTNLYRSGAGLLKTDGKVIAATGLGVGNSATATTLGTLTRKAQIFDASGASLGFVPVYSSIS